MPTEQAGRIDVHAHVVPDFYRAEAVRAGHVAPDGTAAWPDWSTTAAVAAMDRLGVATSLVSVSSPGVHFGDDRAARTLCRRLNEFMAALADEHPGRFGFFAALPLPDVDGALAELDHALGVLGAAGAGLYSNYAGTYPGAARFRPLVDALDASGAVCFLHPTSPLGWQNVDVGLPRPAMEFPFETTRAVVSMVAEGALHPGSRWRLVLPHGGGCVPVLAERLAGFLARSPQAGSADLRGVLERVYVDLAGAVVPSSTAAIAALGGGQRVLYGTDWPFTPLERCERALANLLTDDSGVDLSAVTAGPGRSAADLFPALSLHQN